LRHHPLQGLERLPRIGDHRQQQVGNAVVDVHLQHLGIDEDQAQGGRVVAHDQVADDGVQADRLSTPRGSGHQQMRQGRNVDGDRSAHDVLAQHNRKRIAFLGSCQLEHFTQTDHACGGIGNFDADSGLAWNGSFHADGSGTHGQGQVIAPLHDLIHANAGSGLILERGDHGAGPDVLDLTLHAEGAQG